MFDDDDHLLSQFVQAFRQLDDMTLYDDSAPLPPALDAGQVDARQADASLAQRRWRPAKVQTAAVALAGLYRTLPARLPPLYEAIVLNYRWLDVELDGIITLLANPPGPSLNGLAERLTADPALVDVLFPRGLIPFGKAAGGCYDPICFDTQRRHPDGDCTVVRLDHEEILCEQRVGAPLVLADSFRSLLRLVINRARDIASR